MYAAMTEDAAERRRWTFYEAVNIRGKRFKESLKGENNERNPNCYIGLGCIFYIEYVVFTKAWY